MAKCITKHPRGHKFKVLTYRACTLFGLLNPLYFIPGELAQTPISKLEALFGDSDAAWLHSLAQGCDTDEVLLVMLPTNFQIIHWPPAGTVHPRILIAESWACCMLPCPAGS